MSENDPTTPAPQASEQSAASVDPQTAAETRAFETHVTANNIAVPSNFTSAGEWFKALKSAQGEYTKARQEIAELKKQIPVPAQPAAPAAQEQPQADPVPVIPEELRVPAAPAAKEPAAPQTEQSAPSLSQEEWAKYSTEFTVNGSLSEDSRSAIKAKLNVPDFVINDFMEGQKARLQTAYNEAATRVGGKDTLARVFDWASKNLSPAEQANVNAALASPTWEITLAGLKSKYDASQAARVTAKEPPKDTTQKVGVNASQVNLLPFASKGEFYAARSDPRFGSDAKFRANVEARMAQTDFNKLR